MQPKRHPIDEFAYHPIFCHLASNAAVEASARRDRREACGEIEESATPPVERASKRQVAATAALRLRLPRADRAAAYAALARWAVTLVTKAWRRLAPRPRLDPAVGALRNSGLFLRPRARRDNDDADGDPAGLVPATVVVRESSHHD